MSSLSIEEALNVSESFLVTLYGLDVYKRWTDMKYRMNFTTERQFVLWIMDWLEDQQDLPGHVYTDPPVVKQSTSHVEERYSDNIQSRQKIKISSSYPQQQQNYPQHSATVRPLRSTTTPRGGVKRVATDVHRSNQQLSKLRRQGTSTNMESMKLENVQDKSDYHAASIALSNDSTEDADCEIIDPVAASVKQETLPLESMEQHSEDGGYGDNELSEAASGTEQPLEASQTDDDGTQYAMATWDETASDFVVYTDKIPTCLAETSKMMLRNDEWRTSETADTSEAAGAVKPNCKYCGREYFNISTLQRHIRHVHLTIRNYVCDYCNNSFKQRSDLQKHLSRIHQINYSCAAVNS